MASSRQSTSNNGTQQWLETLSKSLATFAGLATLTYLLGLCALWVPIARAYTHQDYLSAWYAASVVPRIGVAGLGVAQLIAFPLVLMILTFVLVAAVEYFVLALRWLYSKLGGKGSERSDSGAREDFRDREALIGLAAYVLPPWGVIALYKGSERSDSGAREDFRDREALIGLAAYVLPSWGVIALYAGSHIGMSLAVATPVTTILYVVLRGLGTIVIVASLLFVIAVISKNERPLAVWLPTISHTILPTTSRKIQPRANPPDTSNAFAITSVQAVVLVIISAGWLLVFFYPVRIYAREIAQRVIRIGVVDITSVVDYLFFFAVLVLACISIVFATYTYTYKTRQRGLRSNRHRVRKLFDRLERFARWFESTYTSPQTLGIPLGVLRTLGVIVVISFLMAFLLTFVSTPPLPIAEISGGDIHGQVRLLAHTEGFWYVFTEEGDEEGILVAIPDSAVNHVRVFKEDDKKGSGAR